MSDEEPTGKLNPELTNFLKDGSKVNVAISVTKYCAQSCGLLTIDSGRFLSPEESECISNHI
jgi:hypothetical protein